MVSGPEAGVFLDQKLDRDKYENQKNRNLIDVEGGNSFSLKVNQDKK